jgi:hypothetical protein
LIADCGLRIRDLRTRLSRICPARRGALTFTLRVTFRGTAPSNAAMNTLTPSTLRLLGALGLLGSPIMLIQVLSTVPDSQRPLWVVLLELLYVAGWMASTVALRSLRATGTGKFASVFFIVQLVGLSMAFCWTVLEGAGVERSNIFFIITDICWPLSHLLMLVTGVLVTRTARLPVWARVAPFFVAFALIGAFAVGMPGGLGLGREIGGYVFGGFTFIGHALIAASVLATADRRLTVNAAV